MAAKSGHSGTARACRYPFRRILGLPATQALRIFANRFRLRHPTGCRKFGHMEDSGSRLEGYLRLLTDEQRAVIYAHEVSFCTLEGRFVPFAPQPAVNLFETISQMERYVVDSHGNWKAEAAKPENRDRAFILGRTILEEQRDTRGLLFRLIGSASQEEIYYCCRGRL